MNHLFKFITDARTTFIQLVDELSVEELNRIPEGFNNNIIWNFGHIVVSTMILCYFRTGKWSDTSSIKYTSAYQKGSKPEYTVSQEEIDELKSLAISSIEQLKKDYENGFFEQITTVNTATYGKQVHHIDELIAMTSGHDNLHLGYALAQRKLVQSNS